MENFKLSEYNAVIQQKYSDTMMPNKPQFKGIPQKNGLQCLGKVPTARRAPANQPRVIYEKGGNDTGGEPAHKQPVDPVYCPRPTLRPQAFANWSQGGKVPCGPQTEIGQDSRAPQVQPHKPVPTQAPQQSPATIQYNSIMPGFMEALELPAGPLARAGYSGSRDPRGQNDVAQKSLIEARRRPQILANKENRPSIIDTEKLQCMDNLDNEDNWAYEDNDFDYNKKLESEEEDDVGPAVGVPQAAADRNWTDQVKSRKFMIFKGPIRR